MDRIIMAFGPAAMQDSRSILQVADVLFQYHLAGQQVVGVVCALEGVTEMLAESVQLGNYARVYNKLLSMHQSVARKLVRDERDRALLIQDVTDILQSYNWLGRSMVNRAPTPAEAATMLAIGERLSGRLLAGHFQNRGLRATLINASEVIITDDDYQAATPDIDASRARAQARLLPRLQEGYITLVGAGSGGTTAGKTTRLAGGINQSGAALALACAADALWLWTDRDGIMTADPDLVADARTLPLLSAADMDELAYHGLNLPSSQVLAPVMAAEIPVMIRSIYNPGQPGTTVQAQTPPDHALRALIVKDRLRMIRVSGHNLEAPPGVEALARHNTHALVSVDPSDRLTFFVSAAEANSARLALEDIYRDSGAGCHLEEGQVGLVTLIGGQQAAALENALRAADVPLIRTTQTLSANGAAPRGTAVVVASPDLRAAVTAIHSALLSNDG